MAELNNRPETHTTPKCLSVPSWRLATKEELLDFVGSRSRNKQGLRQIRPSALSVRRHLSPVDVYCYLKARFGEPNGFQNFLRKDDSDNLIHWDFNLKAGDEDVYICGMSREIHFLISARMTDEDWCDLIRGVKADYKRVGKEKSAILKSLEHWVIFPNKFVEIASVCADLHAKIAENVGGFRTYQVPTATKKALRKERAVLEHLTKRASIVHRSSLQLSLLTPVLAEAFINMLVLTLCRPEIRNNKRQFDAFIRSHIDTKVFDLFYKCLGFVRAMDQNTESFKNFKRVMDRRNNAIHGNCDPEGEQIELVYFDGTRPLFKEPGHHIGKFLEALERQYQPEVVIEDYENIHRFLNDLLACLDPNQREWVRRVVEDRYPGYDIRRQKMGALFPDHVAMSIPGGMRYDDELTIEL